MIGLAGIFAGKTQAWVRRQGRGTVSGQEIQGLAPKALRLRNFGANFLDFGRMSQPRYLFVIENMRHYTSRPVSSRPEMLVKAQVFQRLAAILVTFPWYPPGSLVPGSHRNHAVKSKRPVNLSLSTVLAVNLKSPVAISSILHRASGVVVFLLIPVLLYVLQQSLESPTSYVELQQGFLGGFVGSALVFIALAAMLFHLIIGAKHLLQDFGIGETLQGGRTFATVALVLAAASILAALVWMVM